MVTKDAGCNSTGGPVLRHRQARYAVGVDAVNETQIGPQLGVLSSTEAGGQPAVQAQQAATELYRVRPIGRNRKRGCLKKKMLHDERPPGESPRSVTVEQTERAAVDSLQSTCATVESDVVVGAVSNDAGTDNHIASTEMSKLTEVQQQVRSEAALLGSGVGAGSCQAVEQRGSKLLWTLVEVQKMDDSQTSAPSCRWRFASFDQGLRGTRSPESITGDSGSWQIMHLSKSSEEELQRLGRPAMASEGSKVDGDAVSCGGSSVEQSDRPAMLAARAKVDEAAGGILCTTGGTSRVDLAIMSVTTTDGHVANDSINRDIEPQQMTKSAARTDANVIPGCPIGSSL